ncbi:hypothetical protein RchiOBHm_Chr7g0216971 [Rosa chinensis]|uniref:Uncharacterized protein n=1 Tax=Rosa chinensis TaxID=74649 RepID=A0A2P6PBW2_ROSCH|nr:hypothetical protein RchiOBHm_Chr7g0216971 [Rosa chinensis]
MDCRLIDVLEDIEFISRLYGRVLLIVNFVCNGFNCEWLVGHSEDSWKIG